MHVCACVCVTHGVNGLMILLTAGGETRRRGKSALSSVSDSVSSRQRGGTGAKSGGNRPTLRHPQNGECMCVRACVRACMCVNGLMILLTAEGETRRRGKSGGTGAKSGVNQRTLRHAENSE